MTGRTLSRYPLNLEIKRPLAVLMFSLTYVVPRGSRNSEESRLEHAQMAIVGHICDLS